MGNTAWEQAQSSGGSSGGGNEWLKAQGGGARPVPNLQAIANAAVGHHSGGFEGFFENAGSSIANTLTGIPSALTHIGRAAAYDTFGHGNTESLWQAWHDPHGLIGGVVHPVVNQYRQEYGPLVQGRFGQFGHNLYKDPLGPALDVLTVATLGGSAALKGVRAAEAAGKLEEGGVLARAASKDRTITFQPEGSQGLTEHLRPGKTLQGRIFQNYLDKLGADPRFENLPLVGNARKIAKIGTRREYDKNLARQGPVRDFQHVVKALSKDEEFALHIAAGGASLPERIAYFAGRMEQAPSHALQDYLGKLEKLDPTILSDPSPAFLRAIDHARGLEESAGTTLKRIGRLTASTREERRFLEQRIIGGGTVVPEYGLAGGPTVKELQTSEWQRVHQAVEPPLPEGMVRLYRGEPKTQAPPGAYARPGAWFSTSKSFADRYVMQGGKLSYVDLPKAAIQDAHGKNKFGVIQHAREEFILPDELMRQARPLEPTGNTGLSPELGPAFRVPHIVTDERRAAGSFKAPKPPTGKVREPGVLRQNQGLRLAGAQLSTHPEVFSADYMATLRYAHQLDMQKEILDPIARPLDPNLPGGKAADESYYRPAGKAVPHDVREQDTIAAGSQQMAQTSTEADQTVFQHLPLGEEKSIEALNAKGYLRVPARFAGDYRRQFVGVSRTERLVFDRPLDVWRALVLKFRPAWMVTNAVGNTFLYWMRYAGHGGIEAFLKALQVERGDEPLMKIADLIQADKRQAKYGPVLERVAPGLGQAAFFKSQSFIRHKGIYAETDATPRAFMRVVGGAALPAKTALHAVNRFGDAIMWMNTHSENILRRAAFIAEAQRDPIIRDLQRQAKQFGDVNDLLKHALEHADQQTIERLTREALRAIGDYSNLSPFERRFVRKVIPFWSWYRTIIAVTAHGVIDQPLRWRLLQMMAVTAKGDPDSSLQYPVPSYLQGALPLGPEKGGTQSILSTQAANPFSTITQLGSDVNSLARGKVQLSVANPGGLLNPFLVAPVVGLYGVDPAFGGSYKGPGANRGGLARAAGYLIGSNPQYSLYQKTLGGQKSTIYTPQQFDYIWNYLGLPVKRLNVAEAKKRAAKP